MFISSSNNQVILKGNLSGEFKLIQENYGNFYEVSLTIPRLSGESDVLTINMPENMVQNKNIGDEIALLGQFRSKNVFDGVKSKLELTVYALSELDPESVEDRSSNIIMITGFVCKQPVYRVTPFGREIADILVAVNRGHKKSDYLPCIAWSTNAQVASSLNVGDKIEIMGRIQSRNYQKKLNNGDTLRKIAYEVSITKLVATSTDSPEGRLKEYFNSILENVSVKYNLST